MSVFRVFTALFGTETNSFAPFPTAADQFEPAERPSSGSDVARYHPYGQVLKVLRERAESEDLETIQGRGGFASPSGLTTRSAYETLRANLIDDLRSALPVDAVTLCLHGAMMADGYESAEGDLLGHIRAVVGPDVPIGAELDLHAHLDAEKLTNAEILVFFKEYPHTNIHDRAAEMVDNAGGGAASDSTFLLRAMLDRGIEHACLGPLYDPGAVILCHAAGAGARLRLRIGGKFSPASGDPLDVDAEVLAITDSLMMLNAFGGPDSMPLGPAAAIRVGGVDVVLTSRRQQALGDMFAGLGVDWRAKRIVALKSSQHFYAVFGPHAAEVLYVDSPGNVTSDWRQLPYVHRPRGLWPLDAD